MLSSRRFSRGGRGGENGGCEKKKGRSTSAASYRHFVLEEHVKLLIFRRPRQRNLYSSRSWFYRRASNCEGVAEETPKEREREWGRDAKRNTMAHHPRSLAREQAREPERIRGLERPKAQKRKRRTITRRSKGEEERERGRQRVCVYATRSGEAGRGG